MPPEPAGAGSVAGVRFWPSDSVAFPGSFAIGMVTEPLSGGSSAFRFRAETHRSALATQILSAVLRILIPMSPLFLFEGKF